MSFLNQIKEIIGEDVFFKINTEAENEVSVAIKMPLIDDFGKEKFYSVRNTFPLFKDEFYIFQDKKLTISPLDVFNVLFTCKIYSASSSEREYYQRSGRSWSSSDYGFVIPWSKKTLSPESLIEHYFNELEKTQKERVLLVNISCFRVSDMIMCNSEFLKTSDFFNNLFSKLDLPFYSFLEDSDLGMEYKKINIHELLDEVNENNLKYLFQSPSIGFKKFGSEAYCKTYSISQLRTFLNLLRISGFLYPGQIDFGQNEVEIMATVSPVFLGSHSYGCYCWDEDTKEPWLKNPDGCLFLSFGHRGLSEMYLDNRTFGGIESFFLKHKRIFEYMDNPWSSNNILDVIPVLDILSSSTQIPDTGAKILQLYCCLEHLFVPKNIDRDNKKYIIGGINALKPDYITWFNELYKLRCQYAHKGFIIRDEKTRSMISTSIHNIMSLMVLKLR